MNTAVLGNIAQVLYGVGTEKRLVGCRGVDNRDVVIYVHVYKLAKELLRGVGARSLELVFVVANAYIKARGRLAQADGKYAIHAAQKLSFKLVKGGTISTLLNGIAQLASTVAQVAREVLV